MKDLVRLSAKKRALKNTAEACNDTSNDVKQHAAEPLKLDIGLSNNAALKDDEASKEVEEVHVHMMQTSFSSEDHAQDQERDSRSSEDAHQRPTDLPYVHTSTMNEPSDEALDPVVLDVGFAQVELRRLQAWPRHEFYIVARDGFLTREGAVAFLEYLDFVLHLGEVASSGFVLTYDLRECTCPQLDLVSWIMHFVADPQREEVWHQRCVCWKVVVSSGIYFGMAQSVLSFLFSVCPPKCRVFLMTDLDMSNTDNWICYKPEDLDKGSSSMLSTISSSLLDTLFPAYPHELPAWEHGSTHPETNPSTATSTDEPMEKRQLTECADSLTTRFAMISQGFDEAKREGYLKVTGRDGPMDDDGLQQIMDFMDDFVDSANAQNGYGITYDLRNINVPTMGMIMRVADWGKQADRQGKWTRLNTSCKIVVSAGLKFAICRGVLKSFFFVCPPVCQTFLLTDPDEPEASATVFYPTDSNPVPEESSHSDEAEISSDDGSLNSADASETTSASASTVKSQSDTDEQAENKCEQSKLTADNAVSKGMDDPSLEEQFTWVTGL